MEVRVWEGTATGNGRVIGVRGPRGSGIGRTTAKFVFSGFIRYIVY